MKDVIDVEEAARLLEGNQDGDGGGGGGGGGVAMEIEAQQAAGQNDIPRSPKEDLQQGVW